MKRWVQEKHIACWTVHWMSYLSIILWWLTYCHIVGAGIENKYFLKITFQNDLGYTIIIYITKQKKSQYW